MSSPRSTRALLLFSKSPGAPDAKSRLALELGQERSRAINTWLVRRALALRRTPARNLDWILYSASSADRSWFEDHAAGWDIRTQSGGDLGERLVTAFIQLFAEGYRSVAAIGGDAPELAPRHIRTAMAAINPGRVVIGPALDGGYYLIGLATPEARLFSGIEWGARDVCRRTVRTALDLGLEVRMLPWLRDIDTGQEWHEYLVEADGAVPDLTPSGVSRRRS